MSPKHWTPLPKKTALELPSHLPMGIGGLTLLEGGSFRIHYLAILDLNCLDKRVKSREYHPGASRHPSMGGELTHPIHSSTCYTFSLSTSALRATPPWEGN